jgi:hypothetical protein
MEWIIRSTPPGDRPGTSGAFKGTYGEAKQAARDLFAATGHPASVWTGLTWHFRISQSGERDWSPGVFAA